MQKKVLILFIFSCVIISCRKDPKVVNTQDYPKDIGTLIVGKCATSGCHNNASYEAANGLNLSTWQDMFKGNRSGGSPVIPYRSDYSSLCYFTNSFPELGIMLQPTMPFNDEPLSRDEYLKIRDWIDAGAPNADGKIKFADKSNRKKFYVTSMTCDVITVFDSESLLPMRFVTVGNNAATEYPQVVKVSPDKKFWYVSFYAQSGMVQKFDAETDRLVGQINLGLGNWNSFEITSDSKYGYFADNTPLNGKLAYVDLENMSLLATHTSSLNLQYMNGMVLNENLKKIYIGSLFGNYLYKIDITNPLYPIFSEMIIDGTSSVSYNSVLDPTTLTLDPENNKCYVACKKTNEIKVIDMQTDVVTNTIPVSSYPLALGYSKLYKKLFVSCPDDSVSFVDGRGSVNVIDCISNTLFTKINSGWQPYGLAVDDDRHIAAVANANISSKGPSPHHVSGCGGRNGYVTFIDMKTFQLIPNKKPEVAVFPYGVAAR